MRNRPLKNAHLLRFAHPSSLRRTGLYPSFLGISQALHLGMLSQPVDIGFFNTLRGLAETGLKPSLTV